MLREKLNFYISSLRSIYFHPEGKCLFSAAQDGLRVYGWEPCRILDCIPLPWGRIQDMAVTSSQLVKKRENS